MPKYLNLDSLAPEKKVITIKGNDHEMHQVSVKEFIEITKAADESGEGKIQDKPIYEQVQTLVDQILKAFPTCPEEDLVSLSVDQLTTILKFTAGALEEEADVKEEVKGGKKKT